jgi:hypothetical protein
MTDDNEILPTYRFRWSNVDKAGFVLERRAVADGLRRDAQTMMRRAEQIEEEIAAWSRALEDVTP